MQEPSNRGFKYGMGGLDPLTPEQARQLNLLTEASYKQNPICQQAPIIWDAETHEDAMYAKKNCLGITVRGETPMEPCPLLALCGETALVINVMHGVWGGMTPTDRKRLRYNQD